MNIATAPERQQLTAAFRNFTELSQALEVSYRDLEAQVTRLSTELASARRERVRQLEERDRLADRLQRLLAVLPGGVLVLDEDEVVRECNPAAIEMLGEPLVGESWTTIIQRAISASTPLGGEVVLASGRHITVSRRALGTEAGAIVLLSDVTEAHLVRELLARHQRLSTLGEMAARLAHQIRTPLAAALLHAARVGHPDLELAERVTLQDKVVGRLRHLEQLVADMLTFARGGGGAMSTCDVNALLEEAAQSLFGRLNGSARLRIRTEAPGLCVHGQRDALVGAIVNLATNALEAGGTSAEVQIECGRDGDRAQIRVSDNGPGIAPELRERIFEPFFTTRTAGTGLGLAVVKSVATAHAGIVRLETATERGTVFVLELPALAPAAVAPEFSR